MTVLVHQAVPIVQALLITLALICLDTLLGWLSAVIKKTWEWRKVGQFLETSVLPYIGGLMALAVLALIRPDIVTVYYASTAAVDIKLVADIIDKVTALGVPVVRPQQGQGQNTTSGGGK